MDEGPFRMPRSADRSATNKPEPSHQPEEQSELVKEQTKEEPRTVHRPSLSRHTQKEEKSLKRLLLPGIIAIVVLIAAIGGWFAWSGMQSAGTAIDGSKYQAVFFTNGQVYFGKLQSFNTEYMKLTDIFYLQAQASEQDSKNPQKTTTDQNNVQLIKLGDEIHGPQDEMVISKSQVLFYENLKSDGKVAQSISKFKNPN